MGTWAPITLVDVLSFEKCSRSFLTFLNCDRPILGLAFMCLLSCVSHLSMSEKCCHFLVFFTRRGFKSHKKRVHILNNVSKINLSEI